MAGDADAALLAARLAELEAAQWLAPAAIAERQHAALAPLLAHHARHSGQFARRLAAAGLDAAQAATPQGFARLGLLTRHEVQSAPDFLAHAVPAPHLPLARVSTSGSTGEPVESRRTTLNRLDWLAITLLDHRWHRRDLAGRLCVIRAYVPQVTRMADWGPPASLFHATGPGLVIPIDLPIARQAALLRDFRPTCLLAYPTTLGGLLEEGDALDGVAEIRTFGEAVPDALRARVAERLGVTLVDSYSSQEVGYIALQCPESGQYHAMAETLLVEVLDDAGRPCAPGGTGHVVVTDLRNYAAPVIRYAIGDMAEAALPCGCGRGWPTLARIRGRVRNLVTFPDGSRAWPMVGYRDFHALAGVTQYQFVQHDRQTIEVRIVADAPLTPESEAALTARIRRALGYPFTLRFTRHAERLPMGGSGKFEEFLSLLSD